jgi:hypothetical protein
MEMRRGVIFTLDALVAIVIAVMALTILMQMVSLRTNDWYKEIALYNSAQDFLTSRDKDGTLSGTFYSTDAIAISTLNSLISSQIPPNMVARINVTYCSYQSNAFACNRNIVAGQNGTTQIKSVVRRVFTDSNNNYYGVAVMEVWYQ